MTARPTTLRLLVERCPAAVQHYEDGAPVDASVFALGTAAHDVLHTIALYGLDQKAIDATVAILLAEGRSGVDAGPPLPPDPVFAGRDLAVAYAEANPIPPGFPELGLAFGADWSPMDYEARGSRFRIRLDLAFVTESDDEDAPGTGIVVRDYKTAWTADEALLDSIQLRGQAVAVAENWRSVGLTERPDFVRREVVNLRTHRVYGATNWLDDGSIAAWKRDLDQLIDAHEHRPRKARPGIHCVGCDYATICPAAAALAKSRPVDRAELGAAYAAALARARSLESAARAAAAESPLETADGRVGFLPTPKRAARSDAWRSLWERWTNGQTIDEHAAALARGFLARLDLGVAQVEAAARGILPSKRDRDARNELIDAATTTRTARRFAVERTKPETITDAETTPTDDDYGF
jgi:hypothetical protein